MITQTYTISTIKQSTPPIVKMSQYDHGSRTITFSVVDGSGQAVVLTGKTVRVEGTRLDGHAFAEDCTVSGSTATFTDTSDMTNAPGAHPAELVIESDGDRLGTMNFVIAVETAAMDENADITEEDVSLFEQLLGSIADATGAVEAEKTAALSAIDDDKDAALLAIAQGLASGSPLVVDAVADMTDQTAVYLYSGSESGYTAGNYYIYNGSAWVSGGTYGNPTVDAAFSNSSVNPVQNKVVAAAVGELKSDLDDIFWWTDTAYITNWVQGYIRNNGTIGSSSTDCATGWVAFDDGEVELTIKSGYKVRVAKYSDTAGTWGTFAEFVINPHATGTVYFTADSSKYYKMDIMNTAETTLAPSDLPSDVVGYRQEHFTDTSLTKKGAAADAEATGKAINKKYVGNNVLDQSALTLNNYISNTTGNMSASDSYAVTDYIEVASGDVIYATFEYGGTGISLRYVAAYDSKKVLLSNKGADTVDSYTVPEGVSFVRISANKTRITSAFARIAKNHVSQTKDYWQPYVDLTLDEYAVKHDTDISNLYRYPLTFLPDYFVNTLAYKPLGVLSKGYICLVSDDGDADIATYTIPMLITKEVPATFAVMKASSVFATQTGIDAVVEAVEDYGCCIAQHGGSTWDANYDELTLNAFFDDEQTYWDTLGLTPYGAVCPSHNINNLIRVVAGGRFGCVRTGYDDGLPRYTNYTNGPRSNMYGLTSQSSLDGTLDAQKATLDYVKDNHLLRIIHWHENELDAAKKAQLEGIIDYAKSIGLTFITMKEIPWII